MDRSGSQPLSAGKIKTIKIYGQKTEAHILYKVQF